MSGSEVPEKKHNALGCVAFFLSAMLSYPFWMDTPMIFAGLGWARQNVGIAKKFIHKQVVGLCIK